MNDVKEVIGLLREEVDKHLDIERSAATFLTNVFLETYAHDGTNDEEDPTPSIIHDIPIDPMTDAADWQVEFGEDPGSTGGEQGVVNVRSSSGDVASDGSSRYNEW